MIKLINNTRAAASLAPKLQHQLLVLACQLSELAWHEIDLTVDIEQFIVIFPSDEMLSIEHAICMLDQQLEYAPHIEADEYVRVVASFQQQLLQRAIIA